MVRHPRITGGTPPPNCVTFIHNSRGGGGGGDFRTALETLSTQIRGRVISLPREREYWTSLESEFDSGSMSNFLTPRDLTSWSQPYRDDKCTKQLYSVWILPVNYKRIINRHARRIDPSTHVLTARPGRGVVSLTFRDLSKIIPRKYTKREMTFMVRISSWNFVHVPKAFGHTYKVSAGNSHKKYDFCEYTNFERIF